MWRDSARHGSPNAGWPGAAMAGALGLKLAGPIAYDGVCQKKPWIGIGESSAGPADLWRPLAISVRACLYPWFLTGILLWATCCLGKQLYASHAICSFFAVPVQANDALPSISLKPPPANLSS